MTVWMLRTEWRPLVIEDCLRIGSHGSSTLWAVNNKDSIFILLDDVKIAERKAGTWVSLRQGWKVADVLGGDQISVKYEPPGAEVIPFPRKRR
jgi:hypothetical protein